MKGPNLNQCIASNNFEPRLYCGPVFSLKCIELCFPCYDDDDDGVCVRASARACRALVAFSLDTSVEV